MHQGGRIELEAHYTGLGNWGAVGSPLGAVSAGVWQHVAVTRQLVGADVTIKIYVNGIEVWCQDWRSIPAHVERQVFFLLSRKERKKVLPKNCWVVKKCPSKRRNECPAYEYKAGRFCWMINGTFCKGMPQKNWKEKMKICRKCEIILSLL